MCKIAKKMVAMVIARKTILCFTKVVLNVEQIACKYSRRHQGNKILLLELRNLYLNKELCNNYNHNITYQIFSRLRNLLF